MLRLLGLVLAFKMIPNTCISRPKFRSCGGSNGCDATGPIGVVCTGHPLVPPDVPVGPILVSGWTGRVDYSTPDPKTTAFKAWGIRNGGGVCQLPPIAPNRLQDQHQGLR